MFREPFLYACLALCILAACSTEDANPQTTFYLVRHAEKLQSDTLQGKNEDPPLTSEGLDRANRLKSLLADKKIAAVYSTPYQRNVNTVKPLATGEQVAIEHYEWHNWQPMIEEALGTFKGKTIVVCGHGDNLLPMISYLNGEKPQDSLARFEYDKIFKVEVAADTAVVETIEY